MCVCVKKCRILYQWSTKTKICDICPCLKSICVNHVTIVFGLVSGHLHYAATSHFVRNEPHLLNHVINQPAHPVGCIAQNHSDTRVWVNVQLGSVLVSLCLAGSARTPIWFDMVVVLRRLSAHHENWLIICLWSARSNERGYTYSYYSGQSV